MDQVNPQFNTHKIIKDATIKQDTWQRAEQLMDEFKLFIGGYRVVLLIHRPKEGGKNNGKAYVKKILCNTPQSYVEAFYKFLYEKETSSMPLRIYMHNNERHIAKGIRKFKHEQLDADYFDKDSRNAFYEDIRNRFISCISEPSCRATSYFMIDCDTRDTAPLLEKIAEFKVEVIKQYPTKNGWHFITSPFNPTGFEVPDCEIKKDGLMLLAY